MGGSRALVPLLVVTVTSTVPAAPGGALATIVVELFTVTLGEGAEPKSTTAPLEKSLPEIVTGSPPATFPTSKTTDVTTGRFSTKVYLSAWSTGDVVPPKIVTVTSTVPAA